MDTKWNNIEGKKGARFRAVVAALAFFLGLSLMIGSVSVAIGRWADGEDGNEWYKRDWRDTANFRSAVTDYVQSFLTLGAGGELEWYHSIAVESATYSSLYGDYAVATETTVVESTPAPINVTQAAVEEIEPDKNTAQTKDDPDAAFENDPNVLYCIRVNGEVKYASDALNGSTLDEAPENYGFFLRFADGEATITKDDEELDVYGDGIYDEDSLWALPGYENFPAGSELDGVELTMAIRDVTYRYYQTDYTGNRDNDYYSNAMYWVQADIQITRQTLLSLAITFAIGLVLAGLWLALRNWKKLADRAVARVTAHIWTEVRVVIVLVLAALVLLYTVAYLLEDWWLIIGKLDAELLSGWLHAIGCLFINTPAVLALFWCVWLLVNDRRCTPKSERRSLFRMLRREELKYPVQLRMNRLANRRLWLPIALITLGGVVSLFLAGVWVDTIWYVLVWSLIALILLALAILWLRRDRALTRDIGRLADQIEAVQSGALNEKLELPADSDLRDMAERLGNIQEGLKSALAEQMRSERMKVELVSNVSHDLKTPLTSIMSYSELLLQEPLEPTARDYALIIDQKAKRLNTMVQDVFEVSKAASDQLPVSLERLDLAKLLRQTLADMDEAISKSGLNFKLDLPDEPVEIIADGKRLYRVFQNLIQNALRYSLAGSRVYLSLQTTAGQAEAALRNTSQCELPNIDFTARFVRGDESRTDGGSGLGLSIAKSFTEACGGSFRIETVADLFTVLVTFPLAEK